MIAAAAPGGEARPPLILLGAASRSAAAIRAALPTAPVVGVARAGAHADIAVSDYADVPPTMAFEGATVINCVGTDRGEDALLERLNCATPLRWAAAARAGGARRFIQLSSFSVFALTEEITAVSPLGPTSAYGRSKLRAEQQLAELAAAGFGVTSLRVPILVSNPARGGRPDKLAALLNAIRATRLVPRTRPPIRRAMLTYSGLGAVIAALLDGADRDVVAAADPEPFSYELVTECVRAASHRVIALPVPRVATRLLRAAAPALHGRLFASMALAPECNLLSAEMPYESLREVIVAGFAR